MGIKQDAHRSMAKHGKARHKLGCGGVSREERGGRKGRAEWRGAYGEGKSGQWGERGGGREDGVASPR